MLAKKAACAGDGGTGLAKPSGARRLRSAEGEVRPGFRAKHNDASRPGRKGGGGSLRNGTAEPGPRKTAMRFMRGAKGGHGEARLQSEA